MSGKKLTLGEKIALAASGNQEDEFPEDIEYGDTSAKVTELDEEHDTLRPVTRSSLRTKNIQLLDEFDTRYSGEKVSRKKLAKVDGIESNEEDDDGEDDDDEEEIGEEEDENKPFSYSDDEDLVSSVDEEENGSSVEGDDDDGDKLSGDSEGDDDEEEDNMESEEDDSDPEESGAQSGMQTLSLRDKQAEIQKGKATLNQLRIWDSLLEVRIRLQKMLLDCNRLPKAELISDAMRSDKSSAKISNVVEKSEQATKTLMYELIRLQKIMSEKNEETKKALAKKIDPSKEAIDDGMNEEITSESEREDKADRNPVPSPTRKRKIDSNTILADVKKMKIEDFQSTAEASFSSFIPYRNQTIQKWNDKTQFAGGKFNRKTASQQISTLRQIEQILCNKERLLKRTQVKRSNYTVIGEEPSSSSSVLEADQEPNPEIFDDDDFYHQLLRELIERKTSNVNDPLQLSHHWLELQKLRTKLKRKTDTKASKGRKIRYDVQAKLVNFMAPQENCKMSSTAVKELFGSLFGQTKQ